MRRNPFTRLKRQAEKLDLYERAQLFLSSVYYCDEEMIDMAMSGCPPKDAIELHCHLNALIYVASFVVIRMTAYESNFYTSYTIASHLAVIDPDHKAAHCTEEFGMHYEDQGQGPAVLFVHGFPLDHTLWTHQIEALSDAYRVIAVDLRGHGQSEATPGPYSMATLADDLHGLLQALEVERATLAALSMGGYVLMAFWRAYPQSVRALVLTDTRAGADTPEGRQKRKETVEQVRAEGTEDVIEGMLPRLLSRTTMRDKPEVVAHTREMMARASVEGVIGALQGMAARPDSTPTLKTVSVPTLIVVGEQDVITPPDTAQAMQDAILTGGRTTQVKLVQVPDVGHMVPIEAPETYNQLLRGFLGDLPD